MACRITLTILSEFVDGEIGNDWQYALAAELFNPEPAGTGRIDVPRHRIRAGVVHELPDPPSVTIEARPGDPTVRVELTLAAAEVDWIFSDTGEHTAALELRCPEPGDAPVVVEKEISTYVEEKPRILGGSANFVVGIRVTAASD